MLKRNSTATYIVMTNTSNIAVKGYNNNESIVPESTNVLWGSDKFEKRIHCHAQKTNVLLYAYGHKSSNYQVLDSFYSDVF